MRPPRRSRETVRFYSRVERRIPELGSTRLRFTFPWIEGVRRHPRYPRSIFVQSTERNRGLRGCQGECPKTRAATPERENSCSQRLNSRRFLRMNLVAGKSRATAQKTQEEDAATSARVCRWTAEPSFLFLRILRLFAARRIPELGSTRLRFTSLWIEGVRRHPRYPRSIFVQSNERNRGLRGCRGECRKTRDATPERGNPS